jgi:hypothetical protein
MVLNIQFQKYGIKAYNSKESVHNTLCIKGPVNKSNILAASFLHKAARI